MRLSPLIVLATTLMAGGACSPPAPPTRPDPVAVAPVRPAAIPTPELQIDVERQADSTWLATYRLLGPATTKLTFQRDTNLFRRQHWRPQDPAFQLVEEDAHEALSRLDGRPFHETKLLLATQPPKLQKDYDLVQPYSDGGALLFTGHFNACPVPTSPALDPGKASSGCVPMTFAFRGRAGDQVIVGGRPSPAGERWPCAADDGTYVYFGTVSPVRAPRVVAVLDPGLPSWIGTLMQTSLPHLFDYYASKTGVELGFKPSVFLSYVPSDAGGTNRNGGVLPGLIQFSIEGKGWERESPEATTQIFQLVAHESAHLWNAQMFEDESASEWLPEGGADAFAFRALRDEKLIDEQRFVELHTEALGKCLGGLEGIALRGSGERRRFGNYYACGAVMQAMVEASLKKQARAQSLFTFWSSLFARARAGKNHYSEATALALFADLSQDRESTDFFKALIEAPMANRTERFRREMERLGLGGVAPPHSIAVERATGEQALVHLMRQDCGRLSMTGRDEGIELEASPRCATLKKNLVVARIGPHPVLTHGVAAYAHAVTECRARGHVTLTDPHGAALKLPCKALPPSEPVLAFTRVAYP